MKHSLFVVKLKSTLGIFAVDKCLLSVFVFESDAFDIRCVHSYSRSAQPHIDWDLFRKFVRFFTLAKANSIVKRFFLKLNFMCVNHLLILCD